MELQKRNYMRITYLGINIASYMKFLNKCDEETHKAAIIYGCLIDTV